VVVNVISLKTEALLLFCRDLITTYNQNETETIFKDDENLAKFIEKNVKDIEKGISAILQPNEYYIRNMRVSRIRLIVKFYNQINKSVSKHLQNNARFNPSMLLFSMLLLWFKELGYEYNSKEFIFFSIYPYTEIYDMLLLGIKDTEYKRLNISMLQIAEDVINELNLEKI